MHIGKPHASPATHRASGHFTDRCPRCLRAPRVRRVGCGHAGGCGCGLDHLICANARLIATAHPGTQVCTRLYCGIVNRCIRYCQRRRGDLTLMACTQTASETRGGSCGTPLDTLPAAVGDFRRRFRTRGSALTRCELHRSCFTQFFPRFYAVPRVAILGNALFTVGSPATPF